MKKYDKSLDLKQPSSKWKTGLIFSGILCLFVGVNVVRPILLENRSNIYRQSTTPRDRGEIMTGYTMKETTNASKKEEIEIMESCSHYQTGDKIFYYGMKLKNLSEKEKIKYAKIVITAKDEDGKIIDTVEEYVSSLYPLQEGVVEGSFYDIKEPAIIEYKYKGANYFEPAQPKDAEDFEVNNTKETHTQYGSHTVAGELKNNTDQDAHVYIHALFYRKGELVHIGTQYCEIDAKDTDTFEMYEYEIPGYDSIEYIVVQSN